MPCFSVCRGNLIDRKDCHNFVNSVVNKLSGKTLEFADAIVDRDTVKVPGLGIRSCKKQPLSFAICIQHMLSVLAINTYALRSRIIHA